VRSQSHRVFHTIQRDHSKCNSDDTNNETNNSVPELIENQRDDQGKDDESQLDQDFRHSLRWLHADNIHPMLICVN